MKRKFPLAGASEQPALKYRIVNNCPITLDPIGFLPCYRRGMGICPSHVHEVVLDCLANTTKVFRYKYVELVKLSAEQITLVRECNKQKCEASNLMPAYSPNTQYGCLSKTHFVFAHKL